jgi:hypothetical protein
VTTQNLQLVEPPDSDTGGQGGSGAAFRETFRVLDALGAGWMAVLSAALTTPPTPPAQGAAYLVPDGATGAWIGHAKHLAIYTPAGWVFRPPRAGWIVVALNENAPYGRVYEYDGTAWVPWALPAAQVSLEETGDFIADNVQDLAAEINARFLADEQTVVDLAGDIGDLDGRLDTVETTVSAHTSTLADYDARLDDLEAGGGGGGDVPLTIDDLVYWFASDNLRASSGTAIPVLANFANAYRGFNAVNLGGGATISATQLNSIDVLSFPATSAGRYLLNAGILLSKVTIFVVMRPKNVTTSQVIVNGTTNSLQFDLSNVGKLQVTKTFVAVVGTATNALAINTWVQANMTYDAASGAWAIRTGSAANGSGTNAQGITVATTAIGYNQQSADQDGNYDLAELIIYNRVLGSTEIDDVEAYLLAKWGV